MSLMTIQLRQDPASSYGLELQVTRRRSHEERFLGRNDSGMMLGMCVIGPFASICGFSGARSFGCSRGGVSIILPS